MRLHTVFISLGSNLGDRARAIKEAGGLLSPDITTLCFSKIYETPPWGFEDQPLFLNQVIKVQTRLTPLALLKTLKGIEQKLGRKQNFLYGPRLIDLDILFYDSLVYISEQLTIPHPEIINRAFVLVPLMEIAPNFIHPVNHQTISDLAARLELATIIEFQGENGHK